MNAQEEKVTGLSWLEVSEVNGVAGYLAAADPERIYRIVDYRDPAGGIYGHEVGWRLVIHSMSIDGRQIYYGETRDMCRMTANEIHVGTFTGTLYGPTTIDQLDPSQASRTVYDYDGGSLIDHYVMRSAAPIGSRADIALEIRDYELMRSILESLRDAGDFPETEILLSKIEQIVTRHYAGKPKPERETARTVEDAGKI